MVWPLWTPYPERKATQVDGQTFDYIIVGGGTAGCALASRLSEDPTVSVLLLSRGAVKDVWMSRVPLLSQTLDGTGDQDVAVNTVPQKVSNDRGTRIFTSQGLGGASRINGLMLTRGCPAMYNDWAAMGNPEWSFEKCEPFFIKMEDASAPHPNAKHRGHSGPLPVHHAPSVFVMDKYMEMAASDVGLPIHLDANDPTAPAQGLFSIDLMIDKFRQRVSAYNAYLPKSLALERQARLTVCVNVVATKLQVSEKGNRVTGVYVVDDTAEGTARQCFAKARREVIVCCGAVFSPQVLMLSGIGPKKHLEDKGIPVVRDLPGVGRNLQDHAAVGITFEVLLRDSFIQFYASPLLVVWHLLCYILFKTGLMAFMTTRQCAWINSAAIDEETMTLRAVGVAGDEKHDNMDARRVENVPDIELMLIGSTLRHEPTKPVRTVDFGVKGKGYSGFYVALAQSHSLGRVELASTDPFASPQVHHPMLQDERDLAVGRKGVRLAMHMVERFRANGYPAAAHWYHYPGKNRGTTEGSWRDVSDDEIDEFLRTYAESALHVSSSCRMAPEKDGGVVGQDLKVHGFENLRVADASVFPKLPSAHTVAPTYMVAERCADFIKKAWA